MALPNTPPRTQANTTQQESTQQLKTPTQESGKRCLFTSPVGFQSPAIAPAEKKVEFYGYLLQIGSILKGRRGTPYYNFQLQTDYGVELFTGFDTSKLKDFEQFFTVCAPICVEVKNSITDGSFIFDGRCYIRNVTELQVSFEPRGCLRVSFRKSPVKNLTK